MHNAIVILQNDPARAENLVAKVRAVSEAVFIVQSLVELQTLASQFPHPNWSFGPRVDNLSGNRPPAPSTGYGNRLHSSHARRHYVD